MHTITITLSDDRLAKLQEIAARLHIAPEELARAGVENLGNWCRGVKPLPVHADGTIGNIHGTSTCVRNPTTVAIRKIPSDGAVGDADRSGAVV